LEHLTNLVTEDGLIRHPASGEPRHGAQWSVVRQEGVPTPDARKPDDRSVYPATPSEAQSVYARSGRAALGYAPSGIASRSGYHMAASSSLRYPVRAFHGSPGYVADVGPRGIWRRYDTS
jgi:hypothetical protein